MLFYLHREPMHSPERKKQLLTGRKVESPWGERQYKAGEGVGGEKKIIL